MSDKPKPFKFVWDRLLPAYPNDLITESISKIASVPKFRNGIKPEDAIIFCETYCKDHAPKPEKVPTPDTLHPTNFEAWTTDPRETNKVSPCLYLQEPFYPQPINSTQKRIASVLERCPQMPEQTRIRGERIEKQVKTKVIFF